MIGRIGTGLEPFCFRYGFPLKNPTNPKAMSDRYFVESPVTADRVTLDGTEAHHLIHVMRAKAGQQVVLFDGSGYEFAAEVEKVGRSSLEVKVLSRAEVDRELAFPVTLAVALPKGDRQKWLVEKAVELGVKYLVPLITERSVAAPTEQALQRLRRSVVEAAKQCGRNRLMEIGRPMQWNDFASSAPRALRLIAHPGGGMMHEDGEFRVGSEGAHLAVGPEGGFSDAEVDAATQAGWRHVTLGKSILRIETAALALVARVTSCV